MVIKNFNLFLIRENLDSARKFLDRTLLDQSEVAQKLYRRTFDRIIKKLGQKLGWALLFTRFYFEHKIEISRLFSDENTPQIGSLYDRLLSINPGDLPNQLDEYPKFSNGFERLSDDIRSLEERATVKDFIQNLPGQFVVTNKFSQRFGETIPSMKEEFRKATPDKQNQIIQVAIALLQAGPSKYKDFIQKIKRYYSLEEVVLAGKKYLSALNLEQEHQYLERIKSLPKNFVKILFDKYSIYIVKVDSFTVNQKLHGMTSHCIVKDAGHWNYYYEPDNTQYYILNFNLDSSDPLSVIGATVFTSGNFRAIHSKFDGAMSRDKLISYLDRLQREFNINIDLIKFLEPATKEEILEREKRKKASIKLKNQGIPLDQVKQLIEEEGADPNTSGGEPLKNAVGEDDISKVEYLLEAGADPNIKLAKIGSKEMFFLLVRHGLKISSAGALLKIFADFSKEGIQYLMNQIGTNDANILEGFLLRKAVLLQEVESVKFLLERGADPTIRAGEPLYLAIEEWDKKENASQDVSKKSFDVAQLIYRHLDRSDVGRKIIQAAEQELKESSIWDKLKK